MQYYFHPHARRRLATRMAPVGVTASDALRVIASPVKSGPGDFGRLNVWGFAANGVRIRVTYHPGSGEIRTVAIADKRYS